MDENQQAINEVDSNPIQKFLENYLSYWPILSILIVLALIAAFVKLRYDTPIYQADASLIIQSDGNSGQESILEQLNMGGDQKNIQNEIELMKSRPLVKEIVRNLHLYAPVTEEGKIRRMSAYTSSPVMFIIPDPDTISTASRRIYFTYNTAARTINIDNQAYPLNQLVSTPYGKFKIVPNEHYIWTPNVLPMYLTLTPVSAMTGVVQANLGITIENRQSTVINLTYKDESKKRASDILNEIVDAYNKAAIDDKNKRATNTLRFIKDRLSFVMNELDSIERSLEQFKSSNRIIDISAQGQEYLATMSQNDSRLTEVNMQLAALDEVQKYVTSKSRTQDAIVPSVLGLADPILTNLLQRLYDAEAKQAQLKASVGENYPSFSSVSQEINKIRPTILENIRNLRASLQASRGDIVTTNNRYNSLLSSIPAQERALININRQQAIKNTIYTFLLQKREETELSFASTVADSRVVNDVQVSGPVSPVPKMTYLIAVAAAIVIGIVYVFAKETLNRNIISRTDIENLTKAPIVAEISYNKTEEAIVIEAGSNSLIAEQFRYLRTSLNYIGIGTGKKRILFTSSISGEGKSFITTNLGATLALAGKRVIMLEMDLRKPKLSSMLNIERNTGLSDYFIGSKTLPEVIKPTKISNLDIVTCGAIPPNPAELLLNGRLAELLQDLEASYDYVLVDTAPVGPVTDAYIISPLCDATLYVVRQGLTPRIMIQRLNDSLKNKRLKNMSIVYNGVKHKRFGTYYGYTYGYGYLEEPKRKKRKNSSNSA